MANIGWGLKSIDGHYSLRFSRYGSEAGVKAAYASFLSFACISSLAKMIDYLDWWFGSIENITVPLYFACLSYVELEHFRIPSTDLQCITTRPYTLITGLIPL